MCDRFSADCTFPTQFFEFHCQKNAAEEKTMFGPCGECLCGSEWKKVDNVKRCIKCKEEEKINVVWKIHNDYPNYEVSNTGLIRLTKDKLYPSGEVARLYIKTYFYHNYFICSIIDKENNRKSVRVHRLVASLFCNKPLNKNVVNHIDGNTRNNNAFNLEWVNVKENSARAVSIGLDKVVNKRPVIRTDLNGNITEYKSINEAFEANNEKIKYASYIVCVCSGRQKTAGGFKWHYNNNEERKERKRNDEIQEDYKEVRDINEDQVSQVVKGFSNYLIFSNGLVYNRKTEKYVNPYINQAGYKIIDLHGDLYDENKNFENYSRKRNAKRKKFRVHRLVAEYFVINDDPENKKDVSHKNRDKLDNRAENLEWK